MHHMSGPVPSPLSRGVSYQCSFDECSKITSLKKNYHGHMVAESIVSQTNGQIETHSIP